MKCPNCGCEFTEGHLYCDNCGKEIRIVPDFEPEIENRIDEILSQVADELKAGDEPFAERKPPEEKESSEAGEEFSGPEEFPPAGEVMSRRQELLKEEKEFSEGEESPEREEIVGKKRTPEEIKVLGGKLSGEKKMPEQDDEEKQPEERDPQSLRRTFLKTHRVALLTAVNLIAAVIVCIAGVAFYRTRSVSYQIENARRCAQEGNYIEAISYLDKAQKLVPDDSEILLLTADYYHAQSKDDFAIYTLRQIMESAVFSEDEILVAYDKAISLYKENEDYQAINDLLLACPYPDIVNTYQGYIAKTPEFSYESGTYDKVLPLKLSANTSGKIYYTLDGTKPDEKSETYTSPIFLETGEYVVSAVFVNDYGIKSEVAQNTYHITLAEPGAPEVLTYTGKYDEPTLIQVEVFPDCNVYYTTDGLDPTKDSQQYTGPIPMPLGKSLYKFVNISHDGVPGKITVRAYDLELNTEITEQMAVQNVIQALIKQDILLNTEGNARGMAGRFAYKFNSVVNLPGLGDYYIIVEYYEDPSGIQSKTGKLYAADIQGGVPNRLVFDEAGKPGLISLIKEAE